MSEISGGSTAGAMNTLAELANRELAWLYPRTEDGAFELRSGEADFGWLRFDERPGANSVGEIGGQRWRFQHTGEARPRVTVWAANSAHAIAEYVPWLVGGGVVSFAGGPCYCWNRAKIWGSQWCFRLQGQGSSVCMSQQAGPLRDGGTVRVCSGAAVLPETPVLVLLAWYLRVLDFEMLIEAIPGTG